MFIQIPFPCYLFNRLFNFHRKCKLGKMHLCISLYIRSSEKFLSFYKEIMNTQDSSYQITNDPFCSIKIKITTFCLYKNASL